MSDEREHTPAPGAGQPIPLPGALPAPPANGKPPLPKLKRLRLALIIADVTSGGAVQGAATITQQFVKNALAAQNDRTVFEKLREAALAYHLTRKWSKEKILTQYLNTVYFGNGAYGIEAAARTYWEKR